MRRLLAIALIASSACGLGPLPHSQPTAAQALAQTAEFLEFEPMVTRSQLFRDVAKQSGQSTGPSAQPLFPIVRQGVIEQAPAIDERIDLLQVSDAGAKWNLSFESRARNGQSPFSEDRREAYQGLSEREVADLVARTLLDHWKLGNENDVAITVERAPGAPYAVAFVDGVLRINPAFLYMAAAKRS